MQQKITSLGEGESHSSIQFQNPETSNLSPKLPINNSQKIKNFPNQIQKETTLNSNSTNAKYQNLQNDPNLTLLNINQTNNNINISYDNENINNQFHTGRWTEEEHKKFIEGILEYGNEWKKVQQIIKTRSSTQARSHAQNFFLRVKKMIKNNNGGSFNINEKDKILNNIINSILPNQKGETLTKNQKEKLLSAISSNIKYEGEINEHSEDDQQNGLEEENLIFKKENIENYLKLKYHKNSADIGNLFSNNNTFNQRKNTIGQKRKLSRVDSRDKIFIIQKDISHKPSLDISSQKNNKLENNENIVQNNNSFFNENEQSNKSFELNKKNNFPNINNNYSNLSHNINNNNDNYDNKNNMNGCIINNIINVTNNYTNNKYICNFYNNDIINNSYNYNYFPDSNIYEKNDSINYDRNYNSYGFLQSPEKGIYNPEKPFFISNPFNKVINNNNNYNYCSNKINSYKENENCNNESNPFELNFNNFNNENYNNNENNENNENVQQISIQEDEFIKVNNNIEDNNEYN